MYNSYAKPALPTNKTEHALDVDLEKTWADELQDSMLLDPGPKKDYTKQTWI